MKKVNNLKAASDSQIETYKRLALLGGWSEWELGLIKKKSKRKKGDRRIDGSVRRRESGRRKEKERRR
jgi:hypothetical protein